MTIIEHNNKYDDEIRFEFNEWTEENRIYILEQIHARGWSNDDCWSEEVDD